MPVRRRTADDRQVRWPASPRRRAEKHSAASSVFSVLRTGDMDRPPRGAPSSDQPRTAVYPERTPPGSEFATATGPTPVALARCPGLSQPGHLGSGGAPNRQSAALALTAR